MKIKKRSIIATMIGVALSTQVATEVLADTKRHIVIASIDKQSINNIFYQKPKTDWGWWVKSDWQAYIHKGLSKNNLNMLELAAKHGNAQAQYVLGMLFSNEDKTDDATYWLEKAAEQGHESAKFTYNYYANYEDDFGIGC